MTMGLSASQARFLQLTARRSNIEYQVQQINFERLQLADKTAAASEKYQDLTSNRKIVFNFNDGAEKTAVDLTYNNYKTYMNQQGASGVNKKYYLVSSTGNKIVVSSEKERAEMIEASKYIVDTQVEDGVDEEGNPKYKTETTEKYRFTIDDFMIVEEGLDDVDNFQQSIQDGIYYFATLEDNDETGEKELKTQSWDTLDGGVLSEVADESDDKAAEAEYDAAQDKIQRVDKKLELQLDQLESERSAIQTEIESVSKVIDDNIEGSFKVFS